jgi:hypothetical protein
MKDIQIMPGKGCYELWVDGKFEGNFDSPQEIREELEKLEDQREAG